MLMKRTIFFNFWSRGFKIQANSKRKMDNENETPVLENEDPEIDAIMDFITEVMVNRERNKKNN